VYLIEEIGDPLHLVQYYPAGVVVRDPLAESCGISEEL
jgi:hypothetical protein